jgi:zinc protease
MSRSTVRVMRWLVVASMALGLLGLPGHGVAGEKLPTVEWVLERYVTATGGRDALLRHSSMNLRGRNFEPATKREVSAVFYTKDGKFLQVVTLPTGQSLSGYDGHIAWDLDSHGKVTIHEGDVVKSIARDADMYYHLHVMQYFRNMAIVDVQTFNGRLCYHLKGVNNWGKQNEQFYDKETGLLVGYAFNTAWRGGNGAATQLFEDYRDFDGVRMPTKNTTRDGDDVSVFTVERVTWDDVPDSVFELPAAVRAKLTS